MTYPYQIIDTPRHFEEWRQNFKDSFEQADLNEKTGLIFDKSGPYFRSDSGMEIRFSLLTEYRKFLKKGQFQKKGPLAQAFRNFQGEWIVDATGGTGKDTALLLSFGFGVHLFERQPIVATLLFFAVREFKEEYPEVKLEFHFGQADNGDWTSLGKALYFDPMYPEKKKKSALARKEMQVFHQIVGEDLDGEEILSHLLSSICEGGRIVVKRPLKAPVLIPKRSCGSITGKTTRYDLY